jgi:hypothetical protein
MRVPSVAIESDCDIAVVIARDDQPQEAIRAYVFFDNVHAPPNGITAPAYFALGMPASFKILSSNGSGSLPINSFLAPFSEVTWT